MLLGAMVLGQASPRDQAMELYETAREQLRAGDAVGATANLEAAYELVQNDQIRFYLGRAYAVSGRCVDALDLLEAVRDRVPARLADARAEAARGCRVRSAQKLVEAGDCRRALPHLQQVDDDPALEADLAPLRDACRPVLAAGEAERAGRREDAVQLLDEALLTRPDWPAIRARRARLAEAQAAVSTELASGSGPETSSTGSTAGWVTLGVGTAIALGSVGFLVAWADIDGASTYDLDEKTELERQSLVHSALGWTFLSAGVGLAITGAVLLGVSGSRPAVQPVVGPGSVGVLGYF